MFAMPWHTHTHGASSTAISRDRTWCWGTSAKSWCSTGAWPNESGLTSKRLAHRSQPRLPILPLNQSCCRLLMLMLTQRSLATRMQTRLLMRRFPSRGMCGQARVPTLTVVQTATPVRTRVAAVTIARARVARPIRESGAGPEGTMQGQLLGTPAYMAPEQALGRHDLVDERTDVYGLGAILYEILTGRPPFIAPKTSEIIRKVIQEAPTPPRQILATIPPGLEGVCLKALRKPSGERYATAAELAQEVQRYLADEPVQAYAEPWTSRVLRWARRHKTAVSAAAVLLLTATMALAITTVLVSREKTEAEAQGQQARHAVQILTKVADIGFDDQLDPHQKEFLEEALQYYEQFTSRVAHDPGVRLEHGRIYQQMGDIQRKLGRLPESKQCYLKAIGVLQPLAAYKNAGPEPRRAGANSNAACGSIAPGRWR